MTLDGFKTILALHIQNAREDNLPLMDMLAALNDECESIRGELIHEHGTMWQAEHGQFKQPKGNDQ